MTQWEDASTTLTSFPCFPQQALHPSLLLSPSNTSRHINGGGGGSHREMNEGAQGTKECKQM